MAISRSDPLALGTLRIPITDDIRAQIDELEARIRDTEQELQPWLHKQRRLTELRYGHAKRRRTPWRGAANITIPLIDGMIRRWRPGVASLMLDADPIVDMTPNSEDDFEAAREAEEFLTVLFVDKMATTIEAVNLVDLVAHRGHAYTREGWDYRTRKESRVVSVQEFFPNGLEETLQQLAQQAAEQGQEFDPGEAVSDILEEAYDLEPDDPVDGPMLDQAVAQILNGAEYVMLRYVVVERDIPGWQALDPVDVITPPDDDPERAEFFCIIHRLNPDALRRLAADGRLDPQAVEEALSKSAISRDTESTQDELREQIQDVLQRRRRVANRQRDRRIVVWEIYAQLDIDGDRLLERTHLWYAPTARRVLGLSHYAVPFETWPITCYQFAADVPRPIDSRGITEMLSSFQRIKNEFHNARLNASQILLSPVFKRRKSSTTDYSNSVDWRPGGFITVTNMQDIEPVVHDLRILSELIQEEQVNQREAETYIGVFDATLTSLQQSRERRTAAEVNAIQGVSSSIFGLDAKMFQTSFSRSLTKIWNLYLELGQDEMFVRIRGKELPQRVRKADIGHNFDLRAAGTPANTNRAFQLQNVQQAMQVLLNPQILASGIVQTDELIRYWLSLLDHKLAETILNSPEEMKAVQQILQAAQLAQETAGQEGAPPPLV